MSTGFGRWSAGRFGHFPDLDLLRAVAAEVPLSALAIAGIIFENVSQLLAICFTRVAIGGAITTADDPVVVSREMLTALKP